MGRPKGSKNKPKVLKTLELDVPVSTSKKDSIENLELDVPKSKNTKAQICDRCHKEVSTVNTINLIQLTGLANYYRSTKSDRLFLCHDCTVQLNKIVDSYLYNNGKGVEKKPWSLPPDKQGNISFEEGTEITLMADTKVEIKEEDSEDFDF